MREVFSGYVDDVRSRRFPGEPNAFHMPAAEREAFEAGLDAPAPDPARA